MVTIHDRFRKLSDQEKVVLEHMAQGLTAAEIARERLVSISTVRTQIKSIMWKLDVHSQLKAVALVHKYGSRKLEYKEDDIFFELEPNGKLFVVHNGYPDVEINVQNLAIFFPNSIFFYAELTTEEV